MSEALLDEATRKVNDIRGGQILQPLNSCISAFFANPCFGANLSTPTFFLFSESRLTFSLPWFLPSAHSATLSSISGHTLTQVS